MSDFDLCKENIRPQRRGHSAIELVNLEQMNDPNFLARRKQEEATWEAKLHNDDNDVEIWHQYIQWAETHLYSHLQLNELRQKALLKFVNSKFEHLKTNTHLFDIFLNSIDESKNWRDVFSFIRSKGFFLGLSTFWCHWAERFEVDGCLKQADSILEEGERQLHDNQVELDRLVIWRTNFDIRVATGRSKTSAESEISRPPVRRRGLGLIEKKKEQGPIHSTSKQTKRKQKSLFVYEDNEDDKDKAVGLAGNWNSDRIPANTKIQGKENKVMSEKWNEQTDYGTSAVARKPKVDIFICDDESDTSDDDSTRIANMTKTALRITQKTHKDVFMQLINNEQDTGKERPMYRKHDIYLGLREISFEELKAQKWEKYRKCKTPTKMPVDMHSLADKWVEQHNVKMKLSLDESTSNLQADGDLLYENEDLVCGILPDTPAKSNKIQIFED